MPTLTAPDGTLLAYDMYEAAAPRAAVLALHGWADHAGRWRDLGERLCAAGYSSYLLDLRGHGRSAGRRGHLSRFSQLLGDLQAFRRAIRVRSDAPQVLLGHSFGGLVALRYLESQPRDPAVGREYAEDPLVHGVMTPGAWREIQWAQRAVPADAHRIDRPLLFLLAGEDHVADPGLARAFADGLKGE